MIPSGVEVFVAVAPIDLRLGFDRLAGLAEEQIGRGARSGALFVFFGKRKSALKILFFDGSGMCLFYKRLDRRVFRVPEALRPGATSVELSERELDDLLDGIDVVLGPDPESENPRDARTDVTTAHENAGQIALGSGTTEWCSATRMTLQDNSRRIPSCAR